MTRFADLARAYEGVEELSSFAGDEALAAYRAQTLSKSREQVEFIGSRIRPGGRIVEVGCGNGRLPIALLDAGLIDGGLGLDISRSRIEFARAWARAAGAEGRLEFEAADALERELPPAAHEAAICITGALAYFDAYAPGSAARLAAKLRATIAPGGLLVLELYPHPRERRLLEAGEGAIRIWSELPPDDPWRFYLSDMRLEDGNVLVHAKTFVHRTTGEIDEGRVERLVLYGPEEIETLLGAAGFSGVDCHEDWSGRPYAGGPVLVVTARA